MQPVRMRFSPYPANRPTPAADVKFGFIAGLPAIFQTGLADAALKQITGQDKKQGKKFRNFILKSVLPTVALTTALANIPFIETQVRQQQNRQDGEPLASVLAEKPADELTPPAETGEETPAAEPVADAASLEELITYIQSGQVTFSAADLKIMAEAGMVSEIISNGAGDAQVTAVLIDGTEIKTAIDNDTRKHLLEELEIDIRKPAFHWATFSTVQASLYAAGIVTAVQMTAGGIRRTKDKLTRNPKYKENRESLSAFNTGFYLAAQRLGLLDKDKYPDKARLKELLNPVDMLKRKNVTLFDVEEAVDRLGKQIMSLDYADTADLNPDALHELRLWTRVFIAGAVAEELLLPENAEKDPSLVARRVMGKVSAASRLMATYGVNGDDYVDEAPDKAKIKETSQGILEAETQKALGIIEENLDHLEDLHQAFLKLGKLSPEEVAAIAGGKPVDEVVAERRKIRTFFRKVFRRNPADTIG